MSVKTVATSAQILTNKSLHNPKCRSENGVALIQKAKPAAIIL